MNTNIKDEQAIDDIKVFSELYARLPAEKKEVVIAFMNGMEAQQALDTEKTTPENLIRERGGAASIKTQVWRSRCYKIRSAENLDASGGPSSQG